jgi:hypothetical protein
MKVDLSDVPNQPLILKHQVDLYRDNTRQRPANEKTKKTSNYLGVYWDGTRPIKNWRAQIMIDKRVCNLGSYEGEEAAAQVYAKAAFKYKMSKAPTGVYGGLDLSNIPEQPLMERERIKDQAGGATATAFDLKYKGTKRCRDKWQSRISMNGKAIGLGTFDTEEEAAAVYAKAAFLVQQQKQEQNQPEKELPKRRRKLTVVKINTACDRPLKRRRKRFDEYGMQGCK